MNKNSVKYDEKNLLLRAFYICVCEYYYWIYIYRTIILSK